MRTLRNVLLVAKCDCLQKMKTKLFGKAFPNIIPFESYLGILWNNYRLKCLSHGSGIHLGTVEKACFIDVQILYSYHSFKGGDVIYVSKYEKEPPRPHLTVPPKPPSIFSHILYFFALANIFYSHDKTSNQIV